MSLTNTFVIFSVRPHLFIALILLLACGMVLSEDSARPKIGLALSGGGARGAAHIGVLKAIEQHKIPIDCIAGTSMGSAVGGMYAAGYSVAEIEAQFLAMDWSVGFSDKTARGDLNYRRKQDDAAYLVNIDVGLKDGQLTLPRGVLFGQSLKNQLSQMTSKARGIHDFDQLHIPFRAVAADLVSGDAVIIDKGNLAEALHASAAIPAVYAPVERNGRLLVDGGVAQNLPVETVRQLCADIVIAVDVSTPMRHSDELNSVVDVLDQLSNLLTRRNRDASVSTLTDADLLIIPNLSDISASSFEKVGEAINRGFDAASVASPRLIAIQEKTGATEPRTLLADKSSPIIKKIKLNNTSQVSDGVVLYHLSSHLNKPLNEPALQHDISNLSGMGYFGFIGYDAEINENNHATVMVDITPHPLGPHYLRFHFSLEDSLRGRGKYALGARHTFMPANALGGEWRNEFLFGDHSKIFTEWYQPWTYSMNWFTGLSLEWERRFINVIDQDEIVSELRYTGGEAKLYGGYQYDSNLYLLGGLRTGNGRLDEVIGETDIGFSDLDIGEGYFEIGFDKLDNRYFPKHGRSGYLNIAQGFKEIGAEEAYDKWTLNWFQATTRGRHTIGYQIYAGSFLSDNAPIQEMYQLGGFLRMSGLNKDELVGPHARMFNVYYLSRLNNKVSASFDTPIYLGASLEFGNVWQKEENVRIEDGILGGSIFLGMDTTLGPVYLAYGINENDRDAFYLFLGAPF